MLLMIWIGFCIFNLLVFVLQAFKPDAFRDGVSIRDLIAVTLIVLFGPFTTFFLWVIAYNNAYEKIKTGTMTKFENLILCIGKSIYAFFDWTESLAIGFFEWTSKLMDIEIVKPKK